MLNIPFENTMYIVNRNRRHFDLEKNEKKDKPLVQKITNNYIGFKITTK